NYNPNLYYISEWWKQLFGESEGKEGKGIYPSNLINTTDLHSMGQYIQEGERIIFETLIYIEKNKKRVSIPKEEDNEDGLNYLIGRNINQINHIAEQGTTMAHLDGGVANIKINLPEINEYNLGELIYFFEYSCALSAYVLGVNPFDQPGVEFYKRNMFKLLGK
ncbi:MAG: glucose-6-phosphate isomerase, partial [Bacteroidales bacterium]